MKTAIIVPYFGKLPAYFQIFLDSCKCNYSFDWIIFTNDMTEYDYPSNVHRVRMNFDECFQIVQKHFDFDISLKSPQKLCDYKCAYGYIFEDYLLGYDWWGHCDLDQIFGDLSNFITPKMLTTYDKLYSLGHLTLYRNTQDNNKVFMNSFCGRERYKEVFTTDKGCAFDEWLPDNINDIYLDSKRPCLLQSEGADVDAYHTAMTVVRFDVNKKCYVHSHIKNSIFKWENGKIIQIYKKNGELCQREYPYVHLQKRQMSDKRCDKEGCYYIIPNNFVDGDSDPKKLLFKSSIYRILNYQYFKVKWKSLKYRISSGDWKFGSVFRIKSSR